jgi:hypothetical protein
MLKINRFVPVFLSGSQLDVSVPRAIQVCFGAVIADKDLTVPERT